MKTKITKSDRWQVAGDKNSILPHRVDSCHMSRVTSHVSGFTIVELLTVIAIIAILAAILLPTLGAAKIQAQKKQALLQIQDIATQIQLYDSAYSRMPVSSGVQSVAAGGQFTYGGSVIATNIATLPAGYDNYITNNSEVIAILMDITNYPNTTLATANMNHQKNPQQTAFLNAKLSGWDPSQGGKAKAGVGNDLIYRDPWGNPYVITMDLNADNQCMDAFYRLQAVSQGTGQTGANGLINSTDANGAGNDFAFHGNVMVWSAGPDGKTDPTVGANLVVNKDNILSWQ
jgi:prepilin-type N-terminal cleavage/methylation domain-containing protein